MQWSAKETQSRRWTTSSFLPFKIRRCLATSSAQNWQKPDRDPSSPLFCPERSDRKYSCGGVEAKEPKLQYGDVGRPRMWQGKHSNYAVEKWQHVSMDEFKCDTFSCSRRSSMEGLESNPWWASAGNSHAEKVSWTFKEQELQKWWHDLHKVLISPPVCLGLDEETEGWEKTPPTEDLGLVLQDVWKSLKLCTSEPRRTDAVLKPKGGRVKFDLDSLVNHPILMIDENDFLFILLYIYNLFSHLPKTVLWGKPRKSVSYPCRLFFQNTSCFFLTESFKLPNRNASNQLIYRAEHWRSWGGQRENRAWGRRL